MNKHDIYMLTNLYGSARHESRKVLLSKLEALNEEDRPNADTMAFILAVSDMILDIHKDQFKWQLKHELLRQERRNKNEESTGREL